MRFSRPNALRWLDATPVIDITSQRNDRTQWTDGWMVAADVHPAYKAGQSKGGDLAKAAAVRNRAARKFGLPTP